MRGKKILRDLCLSWHGMQKRKVGQRRVEQCMELLVAKLMNNNEKELALAKIVIYSLYKMTQLQGIEGKTQQRKCVLGMKNYIQ